MAEDLTPFVALCRRILNPRATDPRPIRRESNRLRLERRIPDRFVYPGSPFLTLITQGRRLHGPGARPALMTHAQAVLDLIEGKAVETRPAPRRRRDIDGDDD